MIWLDGVIAILLFGLLAVLANAVTQLEKLVLATRESVTVARGNMIVSARMADVICRPAAPATTSNAASVARDPVTTVRTLPDAPGEH